jgi:hypothetical protein
MKQLTGSDAMYLFTESDGFPMHIGGVSIYDQSDCPGGRVRFKEVLAMFASRLDRSPVFRRKLAEVPLLLDKPYWIDDEDFDLEFHVRHNESYEELRVACRPATSKPRRRKAA